MNRPVLKELEVLEYDTQLPSQERNLLRPYGRDVISAHFHFSALRHSLCSESVEKRCLSGAYLTGDVYEVTFIYVHINIVKDYGVGVSDVGVFDRYDHTIYIKGAYKNSKF